MAEKKGSAVKAAKSATPADNGTARKAPVKKAPVKKAPVRKAQATKAAPAKRAATTKTAAKKTAAKKGAPQKSAPTTGTARREGQPSTASLAVREGESPWTADEVAEVRALLESDRERLEVEISTVEEEIGHLLREGGEGAGHDQADVGSNTFERDHEMSIARNARDNLILVKEAIARIDSGGYGVCESCGRPIGKMRLQAFPRATLCLECKQRQERR
ncbi:MAG: TraR/DksA C4-type zinc finger protein [Nocardioidaceae bacterium]